MATCDRAAFAGSTLSDVQYQLVERNDHQHDQPKNVTWNIGIKRLDKPRVFEAPSFGVVCSMAVSRRVYNCRSARAFHGSGLKEKAREEVPEGLQEEEGRMERAREPGLQALQQSPSVIFFPVAMHALRLGGGPRAYSFPARVAACELMMPPALSR